MLFRSRELNGGTNNYIQNKSKIANLSRNRHFEKKYKLDSNESKVWTFETVFEYFIQWHKKKFQRGKFPGSSEQRFLDFSYFVDYISTNYSEYHKQDDQQYHIFINTVLGDRLVQEFGPPNQIGQSGTTQFGGWNQSQQPMFNQNNQPVVNPTQQTQQPVINSNQPQQYQQYQTTQQIQGIPSYNPQ